ncbi:MCP four helix bundle domain-containing protein [Pedobacter punctiformis]|uniref:MCP four helix bundle domain-containing protein n=1 Tax=Pedobacter punctiformis TaxID=3004097 RepID=A0ABT4LAV9_9SPHI|nr:MCP four helix bundle domain-containing protein [Pedobacter sp. HCMS5-2]MCZ4245062.1 MCP four helix bundle domain-containing protein [Pedobacter sp. HCMS5-2]
MKFAFSLKNKLKIAFLLFCIMCCSLLIRFLEDKSVKKINESFVSMYNDRLVPATDLYFIAENLYQKSSVLQNILIFTDQNITPAAGLLQLTHHNNKIDSIINKYQLTLLVKQEQRFLNDLKNTLFIQQEFENKILNIALNDVANGRKIYETAGRDISANTLNKLSALIKIQSNVGDELINDSKVFVSGTKIYSTFQVILAIAIGVLIVGIISASNAVKVQNNKFNLN